MHKADYIWQIRLIQYCTARQANMQAKEFTIAQKPIDMTISATDRSADNHQCAKKSQLRRHHGRAKGIHSNTGSALPVS
jgi:hypothetical protein